MTEIVLDGADRKTTDDFYSAFLGAVHAPDWHGRNLDALWDSITGADINGRNLPYTIRVLGTDKMTPEAKTILDGFRSLIEDAKTNGLQLVRVCGDATGAPTQGRNSVRGASRPAPVLARKR